MTPKYYYVFRLEDRQLETRRETVVEANCLLDALENVAKGSQHGEEITRMKRLEFK